MLTRKSVYFPSALMRAVTVIVSLAFATFATAEVVSVPFADGFVGTIGNNTQEADNVTLFTTANIEGNFFCSDD